MRKRCQKFFVMGFRSLASERKTWMIFGDRLSVIFFRRNNRLKIDHQKHTTFLVACKEYATWTSLWGRSRVANHWGEEKPINKENIKEYGGRGSVPGTVWGQVPGHLGRPGLISVQFPT